MHCKNAYWHLYCFGLKVYYNHSTETTVSNPPLKVELFQIPFMS